MRTRDTVLAVGTLVAGALLAFTLTIILTAGESSPPATAQIGGTPAPTPPALTAAICERVRKLQDQDASAGGPCLVAISDGASDALVLEWTGGPANATKWQYRTRQWASYQPLSWGDWTDIPNSGASTRTYRVNGLVANSGYEFRVRPVGTVNSTPSSIARGVTHIHGRFPEMNPYQIAEGDGRTEWQVVNLLITIPDGTRLTIDRGSISNDGGGSVGVYDVVSGSSFGIDTLEGQEKGRYIAPDRDQSASGDGKGVTGKSAIVRDVGALFDQIIATIRRVPAE